MSTRWDIRLEFVTPALSSSNRPTDGGDGDGDGDLTEEDLLEQTHADDRGELFEARQALFVESFDASVPVRVYPNAAAADVGVVGAGAQTMAAAVSGYVV